MPLSGGVNAPTYSHQPPFCALRRTVERERRAQLLEEMEFSLSDAARVARIGKLLSADFLAFGKAVEMGDQFLFSMKLVDVETGGAADSELFLLAGLSCQL